MRQTDRLTDRQTDRHVNRQTVRPTRFAVRFCSSVLRQIQTASYLLRIPISPAHPADVCAVEQIDASRPGGIVHWEA